MNKILTRRSLLQATGVAAPALLFRSSVAEAAFCSTTCASAGCAEATTFLARAPGLNALHVCAYKNLICGLVTDGLWTKFDVLYIFATQNTPTSLLNLVSTNYTGVPTLAPSFTADRGYFSTGGPYIDPVFNASSSPSPNFVRDSAHISFGRLRITSALIPQLWETLLVPHSRTYFPRG